MPDGGSKFPSGPKNLNLCCVEIDQNGLTFPMEGTSKNFRRFPSEAEAESDHGLLRHQRSNGKGMKFSFSKKRR